MESLFSFVCDYSASAYWILFLLLMLSGFYVPISEDIIVITGGAIAASCIPEETYRLYIWLYFGCWISAWEVYWLGRLLGPKLYTFPWFRHFLTEKRTERLHHYYEKFGVFTFIIGRFLPGGVRNTLFLTSGLGKMPFLKFIMRDGFACLLSSMTYFYIGFQFGDNYDHIAHVLAQYNHIAIAIVAFIVVCVILVAIFRNYRKTTV